MNEEQEFEEELQSLKNQLRRGRGRISPAQLRAMQALLQRLDTSPQRKAQIQEAQALLDEATREAENRPA